MALSQIPLSRRRFLSLGAACSLAASPLVTPVALAALPGDARLVVIVLRGGMDGLDVVRPVGDPDFAAARPGLGATAGPALDAFFALHPALDPLMPLWRAGELGFVHAVSTPYRDVRSHFEGQDLLEAGVSGFDGRRAAESGWLNRLLPHLPGATVDTAYAVGREGSLILQGPAPATEWYPQSVPVVSAQSERLLGWVYEEDALFHAAGSQAFALMRQTGSSDGHDGPAHLQVAEYIVERLREETRLATFSLNGWDTHAGQGRALHAPLTALAETLLHLKQGLGPRLWGQTAVLAMTEFGRTLRENGTGGTDHGTGGAMLYAGGAVRGGQVIADWPGLDEAALYDRRDLMPTGDVRAPAAAAMAALFGTAQGVLERDVFPGLDMAGAPRLIL